MTVPAGVLALTNSLFDYAGMYPPASLSLEAAAANAQGFSNSPDQAFRRMVHADLVLDLKNFKPFCDLLAQQPELFPEGARVALLGAPLSTDADGRDSDFELIQSFAKLRPHALAQRVLSYECRVAATLCGNSSDLATLLLPLASKLAKLGISLALEPDLSGTDWQRLLEAALGALAATKTTVRPALKIRCVGSLGSGATGIGPQRIAAIIPRAVRSAVPLKATAGLHHPLTDASRYQNALGFFSLTLALRLAQAKPGSPDEATIERLLSETRAEAFSVKNGISWEKFSLSDSELRTLADQYAFSIGSCSLDEPRADLIRLFGSAARC